MQLKEEKGHYIKRKKLYAEVNNSFSLVTSLKVD